MLQVYLQASPQSTELIHFEVEPNQTITEIMGDKYDSVAVYANGHPVPYSFFDHVRFKEGTRIDIKHAPQASALIAAAAAVGSFVAANAGTFALVGASVALNVASQLLFAPEQPKPANNSFRELNAITGSNNEVISFSPLPKLFGRFRWFPPMPVTAQSYTEQQGEDQYLRQYFILSHGKINIGGRVVGDGHDKITQDDTLQDINGQRPILISETDIGQYDNCEYEIGTPDQITLYSDQVIETNPSWSTDSSASGYDSDDNPTVSDGDSTVRTTEENAEEISLDIRGNIYTVDSNGSFGKIRARYRVEWRPTGSSQAWQSDDFYISGYGRKTATASYRITDLEPDQYDVRLTRVSTYFSNLEGTPSTEIEWNALRTIRKRQAFAMPNCVVMAVRIKATDQLNGRLDKLSVQATSVLPVYDPDTDTWTDQTTRNPAWAFSEVWTGSANRQPFDKSGLDVSEIHKWSEDNDFYGLTYNAIFDNKQNTLDRIKEICTAGRAVWNVDTKLTVIRETADNLPKMLITPRNSFDYSYTLTSYKSPEALKVRFTDQETWEDGEVVVYDRGYNENNATEIASIQAPGAIDSQQAIEFGRFHLANERLRGVEKHEWSMDVHHLHFRRGELVSLQNDAVQIGLGSGRIVEVERDDTDQIIAFRSDEYLTLGSDQYAVRIQLNDGSQTVARINNVSGHRVELQKPLNVDVEHDSMFVYGVAGKVSLDLKITSIRKQRELQARITAEPASIDEMQAVINDGEQPAFDPVITDPIDLERLPPSQPTIRAVRSDESVAQRSDDGSLRWMLAVDVQPNSGRVSTSYVEVQVKLDDPEITEWQSNNAQAGRASFPGFEPGETVTIRARAVDKNGNVSDWVYQYNYVIEGRVPPKPTNVTVDRGTFSVKLAPTGGAPSTSYEFFRSTTLLDESDVVSLASNIGQGRSITDSDLEPATQYYYWVRAVNVHAESDFYALTVTTKNEPSAVAKNLTDYIRNGAAGEFPELKDIGLISADEDVEGSPANRVAKEAQARADDIFQETTERRKAIREEEAARRQQIADDVTSIDLVSRPGKTPSVNTQGLLRDKQTRADLTGDIQAEAEARADALLNQRNQLDAVIEQNQTINNSRDESLANSIATVAAGSGEQFDVSTIWYYDDDLDGWAGGTLDNGYLIAENGPDPDLISPDGIGIDGNTRRYVKARLRKSGDPTWLGQLYWKSTTDSEWQGPHTIDEPPVDVEGITTVSWADVEWLGQIDQIRVRLTENHSETDGYDIDWLAIGRPSPGASTGALQREREARITDIGAETTARETFAAQVRGDYEGTDPAQLSKGLIFTERQNRITETDALAQRASDLEATTQQQSGDIAQRATRTELEKVESDAESARGEITDSLRSEYQQADDEQQTQIDSKASNTRVDEVESDAESARGEITEQLRSEYRQADNDQQAQIDSKASNTRVDQIESDAESARGTIRDDLRAEYQQADSNQQTQIDSKASNTRVDQVESDAESARSSIAQQLRSEFNQSDNDQQIDIDNKASNTRVDNVESDAESARAALEQSITADFQKADSDQQTQIDSKASNTRVDNVESDAEQSRATLGQSLRSEFKQADEDQQIDIDSKASSTRVNQVESDAESARGTIRDDLTAQFDGLEQSTNAQFIDERRIRSSKDEALSERTTAVESAISDPDSGLDANANAIDQTRADVDRNAQRIRLESGRLQSFQTELKQDDAINLVSPPGKKQSKATKLLLNAQATERVRVVTEQQGETITNYGERLNALDVSFEDQEKEIATKASQSELTRVENDAESARGSITENLRAEYRQADNDQQDEIDNKASNTRVDQVESDAESARGSITENLRAEYRQADDDQQRQIDSKASIDRLREVEANANNATSTLEQDVSSALGESVAGVTTSYSARINGLSDDIQAQYNLAVTGTRSDGTEIVGGIQLGTNGNTVDLVFSVDNLAIQAPNDDGSLVYPFIYSNGQTVIKEALIESLTFGKLTDSSGNFIVNNRGELQAKYIEASQLVISDLSGAGDLATRNTADWNTQISGSGKPESNADVTGNNTANDVQTGGGRAVAESGADKTGNNVAQAIANQGAFATLDKVTRNNISAYLDSAAITNAYIGNAAVDTLQIRNQAVTFPLLFNKFDRVGVNNGDPNNFVELLSAVVNNPSGAPAEIRFDVGFFAYAQQYTPTVKFKLTVSYGSSNVEYDLFNENAAVNYGDNSGIYGFPILHSSPSIVRRVYRLYMGSLSANSGANYCAIKYLELKDN